MGVLQAACLLSGIGLYKSRAAKRGCFKRGGFPIWTCPSFFVLFCPFSDFPDFSGIFPICAGMVRGFSRFVLFLFLGLLGAPTRNSPERVRDTIWTFPEKSGKHPGLETPRFSFSQIMSNLSFKSPSSKPFGTDPGQLLHSQSSGHVRPRQGTEICNFGVPSALDFLFISPLDFFVRFLQVYCVI